MSREITLPSFLQDRNVSIHFFRNIKIKEITLGEEYRFHVGRRKGLLVQTSRDFETVRCSGLHRGVKRSSHFALLMTRVPADSSLLIAPWSPGTRISSAD